MAASNRKRISVRLQTQIFIVCAGLVLTGCDPQRAPTTSGESIIRSQTDTLTSEQETKTSDETSPDEPLVIPNVEGDETSLLATETIDPEADETAVTIVILPQNRDANIDTSQEIFDGQTDADAPSKAVAEQSDQTVIATFKSTLHPDMLIGMTALEVKAKIGPADFIRQEGIVVTLQYRMPACVIDLFIPFKEATTREDIANARIDNMQINGTYMRPRIHNSPFKKTDCLIAFSKRRQPTK